MSQRERTKNAVRIAITMFILALFIIVVLGWIWTARHQPAPLSTASHIVLAIAALAAGFGLIRIWRSDPPRAGSR